MKKLWLMCAIILALAAAGILVQIEFAPLSYAGDPAPSPP